MNKLSFIRVLMLVAALYDGVLGLAFLIAGPRIFQSFGVTPPNHWGYVQFPAALLIVFALLFLAVALDPPANRNLLPFGMLLKVSYCAVTLSHWAAGGIPGMWKPFTFLDAAFLVLFIWAYFSLAPARQVKV